MNVAKGRRGSSHHHEGQGRSEKLAKDRYRGAMGNTRRPGGMKPQYDYVVKNRNVGLSERDSAVIGGTDCHGYYVSRCSVTKTNGGNAILGPAEDRIHDISDVQESSST
jgi:hypothetical protein